MNIGIETEYIEFKKSISELKEACESICAMLNKQEWVQFILELNPMA